MIPDPSYERMSSSTPSIRVDVGESHGASTPPHARVVEQPLSEPQTGQVSVDESRWLPSTLASYVETPFRHKRTIVTSVLACMLLGWLAILVWPRKYESEAKLKIRVGRSSVALDPTVTTGETMLMQKTLEEEVITTLDVLGSRQVLAKVVDKIGPEAVLSGTVPGAPEGGVTASILEPIKGLVSNVVGLGASAVGLKDDISDHELAVIQIGDQLNVYAPKKSSVVTISSEGKSPQMAQLMAQTMIAVFMEEHLRSSATPGSHKFFGEEVKTAETRLKKMNQQRFDFLTKENLVSIDANREMLRDKLVAVNRDILVAKGTLEQTHSKIAELKGKIVRMDDEVVVSRQEATSTTWSGIRQKIYELEVAEKNMEGIFQPSHPTLVSTRDQLESARGILKKIKSENVNNNSGINPAKATAREDLRQLETAVAGLETEIEEKLKDRKQADIEVKRLLENERSLIGMDRDIAVLESSLGLLNQKMEESRLIEQLEQNQFSNVSIVQPASLIERAASPDKRLLAVAFTMLGGMLGLALAYLKENSFESVRSADQLRLWVKGLPVTEIRAGKESNRAQRDREQYRVMLLDALRKSSGNRQRSGKGRTIGVLGCHIGCGSSTVAQSLRDVGEQEFFDNISLLDWSDIRLGNDEASFQRWDEKLTELSNSKDLVIVDLPPAHSLHQTQILDKLDQLVVVVESDVTTESAAKRTIALFASPHTPDVATVVLNKSRSYMPRHLERLLKPGTPA